MIIRRSVNDHGTLEPEAVCWLKAIPDTALFHVGQRVRHPESIYRLSLAKIRERFVRVADKYLDLTARMSPLNVENPEWRSLLDSQEDLLRVLQEHLDDCYLVLRALVNPQTAKETSSQFNEEYVLKNLPGAKGFNDAVAGYKTSLRIANKLKHQQGRLRGVSVRMPDSMHLGYYLEEPDENGILGPSVTLHPDRGGFSFAGDLRIRLFHIYDCSRLLARAIQRAIRTLTGSDMKPLKPPKTGEWNSLAQLACRLPMAFFPRELEANVARVWFEDGDTAFLVRYPYKMRIVLPRPVFVTTSVQIDGNSPTIAVPLP